MNTTRVSAVIRKELAEFRRNRLIVTTSVILPLVFLISPTASILAFKATADTAQLGTRVGYALLFPALIPVLLPATMSAYSVVGEREQGTLEPVLTTPVRSAELLAGKALAIFVPTVGVAYVMFGVFFAITQLFAVSPVAAAVRHAPELPAELVFIPLLAAWAIWVGLAVSARASETRVAQQLSALASLPAIALVALISFRVINPTFGVAAALAGGLVVIDCAACFAVSRMFDPERLITSTR